MNTDVKKKHRMFLMVETKTQHGGCIKHVCEGCRADVYYLASIAERLAVLKSDQDGVLSPLLEETHELIARLGLSREKINPRWNPPSAWNLSVRSGGNGTPALARKERIRGEKKSRLPDAPAGEDVERAETDEVTQE